MQSSEEEPKRAAGAMSTPGGSAGSKRHRSAEVHSLSEKVSEAISIQSIKPEKRKRGKSGGKFDYVVGSKLIICRGEEIGSTRRCACYRNSYPIAKRFVNLLNNVKRKKMKK